MKLLLVVAYFVPEIGSAAHIYFDLAKAFVRRGHEVHVITSYPREFNLSKDDCGRAFLLDEIIEGVSVHRCRHMTLRDNMAVRGMEHFLLPYYYFRAYQKLNIKFDACLIYIPPLPLYYFARAIKKFYGTPSVLNYQDFHPQELTDVGLLKNRLLIKIMEHIERQSYRNADFITVLSGGGVNYVSSRSGHLSKVEHIYNGCFIPDSNEHSKRHDFKKIEGIEDKILITYAGILSPFQGLDNILNAAKEMRGHNDLIFYIVGDGLIKDHLAHRIRNEGISNVRLLPLQPRDKYFNIINSSDISLVSLDERMMAPCLPGKLINLTLANQPIVAMVPDNSETAHFIKRSRCGLVVNPSDAIELKNAILKLKSDPYSMKKLGDNGRAFACKNMDLKKSVIRYENVFQLLSKRGI